MSDWPSDWRVPSPAIIAAVEELADAASLPRALVYAVIAEESNFDPRQRGTVHAGNSASFAARYAKLRSQPIFPGSHWTWGRMFPRPSDWRPYGLMMLMPFNLVALKGGVRAGSPLSRLCEIRPNLVCGVRYLQRMAAHHPDSWFETMRAYNNGSSRYARHVMGRVSALVAVQPELGTAVAVHQ